MTYNYRRTFSLLKHFLGAFKNNVCFLFGEHSIAVTQSWLKIPWPVEEEKKQFSSQEKNNNSVWFRRSHLEPASRNVIKQLSCPTENVTFLQNVTCPPVWRNWGKSHSWAKNALCASISVPVKPKIWFLLLLLAYLYHSGLMWTQALTWWQAHYLPHVFIIVILRYFFAHLIELENELSEGQQLS